MPTFLGANGSPGGGNCRDVLKINDMFLSFFVILLLIFIVIYTKKLETSQKRLDVALAGELLSNNMKQSIRNYIITGDERYKAQYWRLSGIRFGTEKWGEEVIDTPYFNNNSMTLEEMYDDVGITKEAYYYFAKASKIAEMSMWNEIESINWLDGKFDTDGEAKIEFDTAREKVFVVFKDEKEANPKDAIDNLYNKEFMENERLEADLFHKGYNIEQRSTLNENISLYYTIVFVCLLIIASSVYKLYKVFV